MALWSLFTALCGLSTDYWQLAIARVGVGIGEAALTPAAMSLLADMFRPERLGRAVSIYSAGGQIGGGLAYAFGGLVAALVAGSAIDLPLVGALAGWQFTFIIVALPGLLLVVPMMLAVREPARTRSTTGNLGEATSPGLFLHRRRACLVTHFAGFSLLMMVLQAFLAWSPALLFRLYGASPVDVGLGLGAAVGIFGSTGMMIGGSLADRLSLRRPDAHMTVGAIACAMALPFIILLPMAATFASTLALLCVILFAVSFPMGAGMAGLQNFTPGDLRGVTSAAFLFVLNVMGMGLGPVSVALIGDHILENPAKIGMALLMLSACVLPLAFAAMALGRSHFRQAVNTPLTPEAAVTVAQEHTGPSLPPSSIGHATVQG